MGAIARAADALESIASSWKWYIKHLDNIEQRRKARAEFEQRNRAGVAGARDRLARGVGDTEDLETVRSAGDDERERALGYGERAGTAREPRGYPEPRERAGGRERARERPETGVPDPAAGAPKSGYPSRSSQELGDRAGQDASRVYGPERKPGDWREGRHNYH